MSCDGCGAANRDGARFCNSCGMGLAVLTPSSPKPNSAVLTQESPISAEVSSAKQNAGSLTVPSGWGTDSATSVKKYVWLAAMIILVAVLAEIIWIVSSNPTTSNPLPVSSEDVLSDYRPRPPLVRTETRNDGKVIRDYRGLYHVLELEEQGGHLIRAAIAFDEKSRILEEDKAAVAVPMWIGIFVMKVGNVNENLKGVLEELGCNEVWSLEPSETVVNGVRIRRHMQGQSLVFEAVSAQ